MMSEFEIAVAEIQAERYRQTAKWGRQKHSNATWQIIATEELGEVCKAILEGKPTRHEIVQLAAVCVAWLEDHGERGDNAPELYGQTHEEALASSRAASTTNTQGERER